MAERTEVIAVEIPVQVIRNGAPVAGLTRNDFQVLDGRKKQELIGFDVVDLRTLDEGTFWDESDTKSIPLAARRHFLLLFDLSFSDPSAIVRARDGAKKLVLQSLHPADLAGVVTFSESRGVNLLLNFTSDRRQVMRAIDELGLADPIDRPNTDPLRVGIGDIASRLEQLGDTQGGGGPGPAGDLLNNRLQAQLAALQDTQRMAAVSVREQKQSQIQGYMNALSQVGLMLREAQGSAHVVLLSEGFDSTVLMGNSIEDQERIQQIAEAAESGRYWEIDSNERYGSTAALFGLTQVIEEFKRSGAVIQAVDIGGLRASGLDGSAIREAGVKQDGLFVLANDTGGELFRNYNDMGDAMGEMLERTSVTYLLTFQPRDLIADGSYHRIDVKLAKSEKGARLIHRPGFYAPVPYTSAGPVEKRMRTAKMLFETTSGGAFAVKPLAIPSGQFDGRAWTPVVLDIEGSGLLLGTSGNVLPLEIYAYAFRQDGTVADFFAQAMGLNLDDSRLTLIDTGLRFWGNLDLSPGTYRLRVLARNSQTGASSVSTSEVNVPDFGGDLAYLSPPIVREPEDRWLLAQEQTEEGRPNPFSLKGASVIPAPGPAVRANQPLEVMLLAHGLPLEGLRVRAWATESASAPASLESLGEGDILTAALVEARGAAPGQASRLLVRIPGGTLEATDQRLILEVEDRQGRRLSSTIEISVE